MDLREKPGKIQKVMELLLRFRLISVLVMVIAVVAFVATRNMEMVSLPIGASEAFGMWLANSSDVGAMWASSQYLIVAAVAMFVLYFVFGGIASGIASLIVSGLFVASLYVLGGAEDMPLIFYGVATVLSVILFVAAKWSFACALFPFLLNWLLLTGIFATGIAPVSSWLAWGVMTVIGLSGTAALAFAAGKQLGQGTPQAGALVKAGKNILIPVSVASLLAMVALTVDMTGEVSGGAIAKSIVCWLIFNVWFFAFLFPTSSFAPWERLRSKERRVQMKDKAKKK